MERVEFRSKVLSGSWYSVAARLLVVTATAVAAWWGVSCVKPVSAVSRQLLGFEDTLYPGGTAWLSYAAENAGHVDSLLAWVAPILVVLFLLGEKLTITPEGVHLAVFDREVFIARWRRISAIRIISGRGIDRAAAMTVKGFAGLPFIVAVHAGRYVDGVGAIHTIREVATTRGIRIVACGTSTFSVVAGYVCILLGILAVPVYQSASMAPFALYSNPEAGVSIWTVFQPVRDSWMYILPFALLGLGSGLVSAFRLGRGRPILAGVFALLLVGAIPSPLVALLVAMAISAIEMATLTPVVMDPSHVPAPAVDSWITALFLVALAPSMLIGMHLIGAWVGARKRPVSLAPDLVASAPVPTEPEGSTEGVSILKSSSAVHRSSGSA